MPNGTKIALYVVFALGLGLFGIQFRSGYARMLEERSNRPEPELTSAAQPDEPQPTPARKATSRLGLWGAGLVFSVLGLGLLIARDVSHYLGARTLKTLYDDEPPDTSGPDYEAAEQEWSKGNFLEAIELLRAYLREHPRQQHVALRIAEIYEKDLQSPLAAALEYEEVLKQQLPPERWGWAAIHLCNLYTGKLNQMPKSIALLQRIVDDYGQTAAADKARARLEQMVAEGVIAPAEEPVAPEPEGGRLPPGFAPKKR